MAASHELAYLVAEPEAARRAELLGSTGHRYFWIVAAVAFAALVAGLAGLLGDQAMHANAGGTRLYAALAGRVMVLQVGGWLVLETAERAAADGHTQGVLLEPAVMIGLGAQVVMALMAAAVLLLRARIVEAIHGAARASTIIPPPVAGPSPVCPPRPLPLRLGVQIGGADRRGPPIL